jgi:hypothetical protein
VTAAPTSKSKSVSMPFGAFFFYVISISMANRIPLIVIAVSGQIEEIPASDNLDLSNNNIVNVGNVTAIGRTTASTVLLVGLFADPAGSPGLIYYNTTTGKFRGYNGVIGAWQDLN